MSGAINQTRLEERRHGTAWALWNFVAHPASFFGDRFRQKPNWPLALAAPALCAVLQFISSFLLTNKTLPIVRKFLAREHLQQIDMHLFGVLASTFASASYLVAFGTIVAAVVCFDVLLMDSGRLRRLAEFAGLSFFAQLPYCVLMVVVAYLWSPNPIGPALDTSPSEISAAIQQWRTEMFGWWLLSASRVIGYYALIWQVVLIGVFLNVVSRLKVWVAVLASASILGLFVLIQLVAARG
jgi:Yip1 domain